MSLRTLTQIKTTKWSLSVTLTLSDLSQSKFIPEGYTFKYTEGNNVSDRVPRIDLVIDIYWRVGLQKAYCPFRLNLSSFFLVDRFTSNLAKLLKLFSYPTPEGFFWDFLNFFKWYFYANFPWLRATAVGSNENVVCNLIALRFTLFKCFKIHM